MPGVRTGSHSNVLHEERAFRYAIDMLEQDRRGFLRFAVLGGSVSLLAATSWLPEARATGGTDALLLSCMDFRLMDDIGRYQRKTSDARSRDAAHGARRQSGDNRLTTQVRRIVGPQSDLALNCPWSLRIVEL